MCLMSERKDHVTVIAQGGNTMSWSRQTCADSERLKGEFTIYLAVANDSKLMRAFRYEACWQPVEQGIIPHQAH